MVKTDIATSKSMRRPRSDTDPVVTTSKHERDKFRNPFPVKSPSAMETKGLPPTPPSETEGYGLQRSTTRSRSQPARGQPSRSSGMTERSSGSSEYSAPQRPRLATVRDDDDDENDRYQTDMRRAQSMSSRGRQGSVRELEARGRQGSVPELGRQTSRREPARGRRQPEDSVYDLYDYYEGDKPTRSNTTGRRPLQRNMSRSRASSSSRGRRDFDDTYSDEEDEFEMVTPKRTEISKVTLLTSHLTID
jgi:hypothetical protein